MVDVAPPAQELADGVDAALAGWVERCVDRIHRAWVAGPPPAAVTDAARLAGVEARADIGPRVRALLAAGLDDQRTTPLALIREGVVYPTRVLAQAGVPPVDRDPVDAAMFPADVYGLSPASFADVAPGLTAVAIAWGAAKAWEHRQRHVR